MNAFNTAIRREFRVAFSRRAQPVWFRILKWTCLVAVVARFHDRSWFLGMLAIMTLLAFSLHFFYRWKTRTWTRSWGGWNDLAAGRD